MRIGLLLLPAPFLLATRFLILIFSLFFVSGPCARLSWPFRQLLSARKSTVSYRIVSYRIVLPEKDSHLSHMLMKLEHAQNLYKSK